MATKNINATYYSESCTMKKLQEDGYTVSGCEDYLLISW